MSSSPPASAPAAEQQAQQQTSKVKQPAWAVPEPSAEAPKLKVWNSLTRSKVGRSLSSPASFGTHLANYTA